MVNSDRGSVQSDQKLAELLDKMAVELALEVGRRLYDGGAFELAPLAAHWAAPETFADPESRHQVLAEIETRFGSTLLSECQELWALEHVGARLARLERGFLQLLCQQAKRSLNTISFVPPLGTLATQTIEGILAVSIFAGPGAPLFQSTWDEVVVPATTHLDALLAQPTLVPAQIRGMRTARTAERILFLGNMVLTSVETLGFAVRTLARTLVQPPSAATPTAAAERDWLGAGPLPSPAALDSGWEASRSLLWMRKVLAFGLALDAHLHQLDDALGELRALDAKVLGGVARDRNLSLEASFYTERLGVQLRLFGESPDDVSRLSTALYHYAVHNNTPCAEVLDEEISQLNPRVSKDNITRAKLELRLNDPHYPLSVAHKEWITDTVRRADG